MLDATVCSADEVRALYFQTQLLLLDNVVHVGDSLSTDTFKTILSRHADSVSKSWIPEDGSSTPNFLQAWDKQSTAAMPWYASVTLDGSAARDLDSDLRLVVPRQLQGATCASHRWVFFGCNPPGCRPFLGRPEHTDDVESVGTWHMQVLGTKTWLLRPAQATVWPCGQCPDCPSRLRVDIQPGQALLLNTSLYLHETALPAQHGPSCLSLSVARDIVCWQQLTTSPCIETSVSSRHQAVLFRSDAIAAECGYASVLCNVEMCAICGTPTNRQSAHDRCNCLCCTTTGGTLRLFAIPRVVFPHDFAAQRSSHNRIGIMSSLKEAPQTFVLSRIQNKTKQIKIKYLLPPS